MKKNQVYKLCLFTSILLISSFCDVTESWSYPLKDITLSNCENCTLELPKIKNANYYTYRNSAIYRKVYSMLRLSTYYGGRDSGIGSHQGVDIVTTSGTPVYSTYDGIVVEAGERGGRGKVVVIQHEWNNQIYYSVYAHLSEIKVEIGDYVSEGDEIGLTGESGNVTGPHLHFQIETNSNGSHPFFPSGCEGTIDEIVNEGNCIKQIKENTIDPIVFLEQTTKLSAISGETQESLYISPSNIKVTGFKGGFLESNSISKINISQIVPNSKLLLNPIQVYVDPKYLTITPSKIQTLVGDRNIFIQTTNQTGITILTIKYGELTLARFPVLIGTLDKILSRKENATLIEALHELGISVD